MVCVRTKDDRSVLHSACASSNVDVVRRLLKAGADVNVQSKDGATPIARVSHPLLTVCSRITCCLCQQACRSAVRLITACRVPAT